MVTNKKSLADYDNCKKQLVNFKKTVDSLNNYLDELEKENKNLKLELESADNRIKELENSAIQRYHDNIKEINRLNGIIKTVGFTDEAWVSADDNRMLEYRAGIACTFMVCLFHNKFDTNIKGQKIVFVKTLMDLFNIPLKYSIKLIDIATSEVPTDDNILSTINEAITELMLVKQKKEKESSID